MAATQVTPDDVLGVVDAVRERHACVVDADETSPVASVLLGAATAIVGVAGASPVGVVRALEWAALVRRRVPATPVHLAVNRAPGARYRREEIRAEIVRTLRPESITWLPTDRAGGGRGMGRRARGPRTVPGRGRVARARSDVPVGGDPVGEEGMSTDAYDVIRRDVHARIERRRLRPEADLDEVRAEVGRAVDDYQRVALLGEELPLVEPAEMAERVLRSITDFGALTELLARRDVEEIFIEGARVSYLDGSGRLRGLTVPTSEEENRQIVERMLAATDRQLNTKHPMVQARVLGGTARLTAAIPPVGDQLSATLRRYVVRNVTLDDLVERDSLSREGAAFLRVLMQLRSRIAVSGEPGAGKTTLVAALLAAAPAGHCVRACEEIRELAVPITHGSYYEVRPPALDGTGEISLRDLVKFVLAMRPDRIVVGEVRGAEAFELSRAVNAGCGFLCTVHANSASEAPRRAGERRADGGRERDRAHRPQGVLGVARRGRAPRPRRRRCGTTAGRCAGASSRSRPWCPHCATTSPSSRSSCGTPSAHRCVGPARCRRRSRRGSNASRATARSTTSLPARRVSHDAARRALDRCVLRAASPARLVGQPVEFRRWPHAAQSGTVAAAVARTRPGSG